MRRFYPYSLTKRHKTCFVPGLHWFKEIPSCLLVINFEEFGFEGKVSFSQKGIQ